MIPIKDKNNMNRDYNAGLDTAGRIVEEMMSGTPEAETILCGIESSKIDDENSYCEACGSCGETGCCPPIKCEAVKCKYSEINLKDYECFQNQWDIMYNALFLLKDVASEESVLRIIQCALKAVDKEWDKLYSKE